MRRCKRNSAAASSLQAQLDNALAVLRNGGVIAYPTEFCFGLGCDPQNKDAVQRILDIKQRQQAQGLILVAATEQQVAEYAEFNGLPRKQEILASWPGPNTWLLPARDFTPLWIKGHHSSVAMRVSNHPLVTELCRSYGGAIVSTSANHHGADALTSAEAVADLMGEQVDFILNGALSEPCTDQAASNIIDGLSGERIR